MYPDPYYKKNACTPKARSGKAQRSRNFKKVQKSLFLA
jgi:hypothetical protein